jgi:hypothetical protein
MKRQLALVAMGILALAALVHRPAYQVTAQPVGCNAGPTNTPSADSTDLDRTDKDWGVYCEKTPTWVMTNVTAPTHNNDPESLRCGLTGGSSYSNIHCYRNLLIEPNAATFMLDLYFQFTATTCNTTDSVVQALEFSMSKWYQAKRYEVAIQYQNVIAANNSSPQWRYWDPFKGEQWVAFSQATCLSGGNKWYHLVLNGEIVNGHVHYQNFSINDSQSPSQPVNIGVMVPPSCEIVPLESEPKLLAVAVQVDGNKTPTPYDLFIDKVNFIRGVSPSIPPPASVPTLNAPADKYTTTNSRPAFSWVGLSGTTTYELELGSINPPRVIIFNHISGTSFFPPHPLLPRNYYWRVRVTGAADWSQPRCIRVDSPSGASPLHDVYTTHTPTLTWNRVSWKVNNTTIQPTAYEVQVAKDAAFQCVVYKKNNIPSTQLELTTTLALENRVYYWRIRAQQPSGLWTPWSAVSSFIVDAPVQETIPIVTSAVTSDC